MSSKVRSVHAPPGALELLARQNVDYGQQRHDDNHYPNQKMSALPPSEWSTFAQLWRRLTLIITVHDLRSAPGPVRFFFGHYAADPLAVTRGHAEDSPSLKAYLD